MRNRIQFRIILPLLVVFVQCVFIDGVYAQAQDSTLQKTSKSGYNKDLELGVQSIMSFLMMEDDAQPAEFLRFPKLDSLSNSWFDWKKKVNEKIGLQFNVVYMNTNQYARTSPDKVSEFASSGFFKFNSRWTLINRGKKNNGLLSLGFDHRHKFTSIPPSDLGFKLGYNGIPALLFTDAKMVLTDLNWQQKFSKGRGGVILGRYDPNDFFDILGYVNPFTTFQNLSILLNTSIALPDHSTGVGIGYWFTDQFGALLTVNDVNGTVNDLEFFEDFGELYTSGEIIWSPTRAERYFKNIHITAWHSDEREGKGIEESRGLAIGANWTFFEQLMPYIRMGWSDGSASISSQYYGGGFIYRPNLNKDLLGLGISWGETQDGIGQLTSELFYRFQFSSNFALTPSLQFLNNPGLAPERNNIILAGLRARLAL